MHLLAMSKIDLQEHVLAIVLLASLGPYQVARAQQPLHMPSPELTIPGVAEKSPISAPTIDASTYSNLSSAEALAMQFKDAIPRTRSVHDAWVFRQVAPSVVLILAAPGFGSGSLLQSNLILTSFHLVNNSREVTVVFKPADPNGKAKADEVVKGDVLNVDVLRDLALIHPRSLPKRIVHTLEISTEDVEVGADVHAIGHPKGEEWTYTKGLVSAVRPDYEWSYSQGDRHRATVIQTQTPINLGNSGGPLLSDEGKIVGVNTFVKSGAEGLNFAVAAKEIRYFLQNPDNGMAALGACNQPKIIYEGRNRDNNAFIRLVSLRCDDKADVTLVWPDNQREPNYALFDVRRRGKPNGIVFDRRRSGKWDISYWESELFDGTFSWQGVHPDGELIPKSFVPRCGNRRPLQDLKCAA